MKEIGIQLLKIWKGISPLQKTVVAAITLFVVVVLSYLAIKATASKQDEKPFSAEEDQLDPQHSSGGHKGFELFDTNTWIKGEKELQVLEMRALKGQLERDLTEFEQIKGASVILDMAPGRSFGSSQHKTKASVILSLNPGSNLAISQLRAITYHLAGAVHGLEPNMIAISDTTGKLYKILDPEGEEDLLSNASLAFEEHLNQKICAFLTPLVGKGRYSCSVQAFIEKGKQQPNAFSIAVAIDKEHENLIGEIKNQLAAIAAGYEAACHLAVDLVPFEKKKGVLTETKEIGGYGGFILTAGIIALSFASLFPLFRRYSKKKQEDTLFQAMTRVDIGKLADSIKEEDPKTIALMLSYLEPVRAEQLIASFSEELREEILNNLSEMEYDNY